MPIPRNARAAEDDGDARIKALGDEGDLDPAPAVGRQDREADHVRLFPPAACFPRAGSDPVIVPFRDLDRVAVFLQGGRYVVCAHGRELNVFSVQPGVEGLRMACMPRQPTDLSVDITVNVRRVKAEGGWHPSLTAMS